MGCRFTLWVNENLKNNNSVSIEKHSKFREIKVVPSNRISQDILHYSS